MPGGNQPQVKTFGVPGYGLRSGSTLDRALLLKFMQRTYEELYPAHSFSHLARTVEQHFSSATPLWWVERSPAADLPPSPLLPLSPVACLWLGNALDQVTGDRQTYVFLLYVSPDHRRLGIGAALMQQAETWARQRGDRQMGLQVFHHNAPALGLYSKLGYQPQSVWMMKRL